MLPFISEMYGWVTNPRFFGESTLIAPFSRPFKAMSRESRKLWEISQELDDPFLGLNDRIKLERRMRKSHKAFIDGMVDIFSIVYALPRRFVEDTILGDRRIWGGPRRGLRPRGEGS